MAEGERLISWIHPCLASKVVLTLNTILGHGPLLGQIKLECVTHTTPQRTRHPCLSYCTVTWKNVQEHLLLAHACTSSAGAKCHAMCPIRAYTCHEPYARTMIRILQPRGSALIPFVTHYLPKLHCQALPKGKPTYPTHYLPILFILSSLLRVKEYYTRA